MGSLHALGWIASQAMSKHAMRRAQASTQLFGQKLVLSDMPQSQPSCMQQSKVSPCALVSKRRVAPLPASCLLKRCEELACTSLEVFAAAAGLLRKKRHTQQKSSCCTWLLSTPADPADSPESCSVGRFALYTSALLRHSYSSQARLPIGPQVQLY